MATGTPIYPAGIDSDATLGPTSGILSGTTHTGDAGANQGKQLGITQNLINAVIAIEQQAGADNGSSFTNGSYVQPAIGSNVMVTQYDTTWMQVGMLVFVKPHTGLIGGIYFVRDVPSSTTVNLINLGISGINTAAGNTVPTLSAVWFLSWSNSASTDTVAMYEREWDNEGTTISPDWAGTFTGSAAIAPDATAGDSTSVSAIGLWAVTSGATAASVANIAAKQIFIPTLVPVDVTFSVVLEQLSLTGTQEYTFGVGLCNSTAASIANPFMGVGYKLNGGNADWNVFAGTSMGANLTDTGVAVATNTLYHLRMTLNQGWSSLSVWVNHAGPTVVTTNLQSGQMFPCLILSSTIGTTSKVCNWGRTKLRIITPR